ncbi:two-component sensor histidine kinase [Rhodococcus sp. 05-2255-3B1]|uniref:sensor histidine kinase n=1 Tax=unclassified Rhodococcus (in: high G+C Gram-positive bacteria) TaxID=192944 RepID=UPI000B9A7989|nr:MULTISPECIES: histidine kinase [unclassified Rhodococcus (in: high G+C Gram-positive bacteria)]OZE06148.1 two-component sensor histidine kinase [Rhodococcus sp. 05-2255-3B1]OZE07445.1 two-component sensor histidine kinase [Rhodococcus sp. 05-2255-3C]OZE18301.1 two-component sensor histidine kinase [Rhodococcus sp. 05-2255-2A2]
MPTRLGGFRAIDVLIVAITATLYSIAWPTLPVTHQVSGPLLPIVGALAAFPFALIRVNPALGWAVSALFALVIPVAFDRVPGYDYPWQVVHILVLLALLFAVAVRSPISVLLVAWPASMLVFFAYMPGADGVGWSVGLTAIVVFGLLIRWLVLSRRQLAQQEEVSELERTRRTVLEEKAKIARDLHDVVAHHMSMVVVQAQSAQYRLDDVSDSAAQEFESIAVTAREALNEIRGMLGVLRSDGAQWQDAPAPNALDLERTLHASRKAGMDVRWTVTGRIESISDTTGLALYRVLQESLSNAARHAPGAAVTVDITVGPSTVVMTVINTASPSTSVRRTAGADTGGHGITGMHDRARAAHGTLHATYLPDGGFEVAVHVPNGMPISTAPVVRHDLA